MTEKNKVKEKPTTKRTTKEKPVDFTTDIQTLKDQIKTLQNQQTITVKLKKLDDIATIPTYVTPGSAGMDIVATDREFDAITGTQVYHTGLSIEIPKGYVGLLFPKSGIFKRTQTLANCVGVIDSNYRGEIIAKFKADNYHWLETMKRSSWVCKTIFNRFTSRKNCYNAGDQILQLIIMPYPKINFVEVDELSNTERGAKGFGEADLLESTKE